MTSEKPSRFEFNIYPAIDLRGGHVVRLQLGDPNRQTIFDDDPLSVARQWAAAGSRWLHVVNLDGAFEEAGTANWEALPKLVRVGVNIQFGGGIRRMADIERVLEVGVTRVILGTSAVEDPDLVATAVIRFGQDRIAVGIDACDDRVKTRGWQKETTLTPIQLGRQMKALGVQHVIFTDISRDGVLAGVNVETTAELAQATDLRVIASGGVASFDDVINAYQRADQGVVGLIIGRALYDGRVDLRRALEYVTS